ncbi:Cytochrome P450 monooxygenase [Pseudocercospora fuligena]|uniref:Cytochrome P450 monooxygenase n=1 Tax=Pseudocercospora fuligena TaxID=685502 RepID=A0A8H6RVS8_9PEZI|nr:Cytochrome P450 monooxygenase [Pseudocercospora fuligena]
MAQTGLQLLAPLGAGVVAHLIYFNRYESHRYTRAFVSVVAAYLLGAPLVISRLYAQSTTSAAIEAGLLLLAFLVGAIGSTLIYRIFFNPLNRFPGPFAARLTNFYIAFRVGRTLQQWRILEDLHRKHGPIVRTGASRVSIIDPDWVEASYGQNSVAQKGPWYDNNWPSPSVQQERSRAAHDLRRKSWAPAFSDKALREYETHIKTFNGKFLLRVAEHQGGRVNVSKWFNLYSFDLMGALAFGKNYGMMDSGEKHAVLNVISTGLDALGLTLPTWFMQLLRLVPGDPAGIQRLYRFSQNELKEAINNNFHASKDAKVSAGSVISSWLHEIYKDIPNPWESRHFCLDSQLIIVAGSDTTAAALTWLFYHLAQNPKEVRKLRNELRACAVGDWSDKDIRHCEHLNASINEALRLALIGPTGIYRTSPPEGMQVGEVFLPGNVEYNISQYFLGRDEAIYTHADQFIPERWYSKPELVKHKKAFAPFLTGSFGCIGKNLAMMEMRTLTTSILLNYDVGFAPGEDGSRIWNDSKEHFTMDLAPLDLVFTALKH